MAALTFGTLQATIANLRFPDDGLLRSAGLAPLSKVYAAYPTVHDGVKLCVLLPHGLHPRDASRLDELSASTKRVFVLKQEQNKWTKVWPSPDDAEVEEVGEIVEEE